MANYFRITAYHPQKDVCAVLDSNGMFDAIWQFLPRTERLQNNRGRERTEIP